MYRVLPALALLPLLPAALGAQSLAERVRGAGDGTVRLSFAARPGVCGTGTSITLDADDEWEGCCASGPVRVSLRMRAGRVTGAEARVGGRWRAAGSDVTDLGTVPARAAADLLLALARQAERSGGELLTAATLADSAVVWPELLRLARAPELPMDTRRQAVFWLGQAAGDAATHGLDSIAVDGSGDLELREHAVFALSQRPAEEGVPALIRIARSNPSPQLRRKALFWLGQSDDPRALALFEELLQ